MTDRQQQQMSNNNNLTITDNSYVHKKFKKVAALQHEAPAAAFSRDVTPEDSLKPLRKRSSNSFSFETVVQAESLPPEPVVAPVLQSSCSSRLSSSDTWQKVSADYHADTVDSNYFKLQGKSYKFGIRDIIQSSVTANSENAAKEQNLTLESQRKRCISECLMGQGLMNSKLQRLDDWQQNQTCWTGDQLIRSQGPGKEPPRRPAVDFSISSLMRPSTSRVSCVSQNPNNSLCGPSLHNASAEFSKSVPPFSQNLNIVERNREGVLSTTPFRCQPPFAIRNTVDLQQVPKPVQPDIVDLSSRRKEIMNRGLPLVSNFQFVSHNVSRDDRNLVKPKKDDSPRVSRELKFHNYTIDSVPYLISPTKSRAFIPEKSKDQEVPGSSKDSAETKKFCRPTSLPLKPGTFQQKKVLMSGVDPALGVPKFQDGGHVLISPDTPRPSKAYNQTFLNGYSYTTLGLKCSTRVYFCCLSKPQPMYVVQETDPRLSMYSQWQVRPSAVDLSQAGLSPVLFLSSYDSRQRQCGYTNANSKHLTQLVGTTSNKGTSFDAMRNTEPKELVDGSSKTQQEAQDLTMGDGQSDNASHCPANEVVGDMPTADVDLGTTDDDCSEIDPGDLNDCPLDMSKKNTESMRINPLDCSGIECERLSGSSPHPASEEGGDQEDFDEEIDVKTEFDEESLDQLSDRAEGFEVPCSSKNDPDGFDSLESEGSPESLVRRLTDTIRSGQRKIGRGSSPAFSVNDGEGRSTCHFCQKVFYKASQLRLHINIHYIERPFKCVECGVSFRNKGHLKKHLQSAIHLTKVNKNGTFGVPSEENPRPFKCADCLVAFRIHGHLAKHLRSKSHIMKLECNGKLPFGTYAEIERSGINVNEIDTTDCQNTLDSLKALIVQRFGRLNQQRDRRPTWDSKTSTS